MRWHDGISSITSKKYSNAIPRKEKTHIYPNFNWNALKTVETDLKSLTYANINNKKQESENLNMHQGYYNPLGSYVQKQSFFVDGKVSTTDSCLSLIETYVENDQKMFHCKMCPYTSVRRNDMIVHVRRHLGEKPYKCSICDHRCAKKSNLNAHVITAHRNIIPNDK